MRFKDRAWTWSVKARLASAVAFCILFSHLVRAEQHDTADVDTALILAVDVSNSVDETRYRLQMEGIAQALEDTSVIDAITSGPNGAIALSLVTWADHAELSIPWRSIRSKADAVAFAELIRHVPQLPGEYTCTARMLEHLSETIVPAMSVKAKRVVIDVSGDGIDNCGQPGDSAAARDALAQRDVTINGLPIIVQGENDIVGAGAYRAPGYGLKELPREPDRESTTLDAWYKANVIGGPYAFLILAHGFADFGRAFRQKFVTEVSEGRDLDLDAAVLTPRLNEGAARVAPRSIGGRSSSRSLPGLARR